MADLAKVTKVAKQSRAKYSLIRRQLTLQAACDGEALKPWMKKLALWYIDQVNTPKPEQVKAKAESITGGQPISQRSIVNLLRNPAWLSFVAQCEDELVTRARNEAESRTVNAVKTHFDAIDELAKAEKWSDIAKFTNPILDRVWSVGNGVTQPAQIVQIIVGQAGSFAAQNAKLHNAVEIAAVEEVKGG